MYGIGAAANRSSPCLFVYNQREAELAAQTAEQALQGNLWYLLCIGTA